MGGANCEVASEKGSTANRHDLDWGALALASFPGPFEGEKKGPGTHCLRMRVIFLTFRGIRILL